MPTYRGKFSVDSNPNSDDSYPAFNAESLEEAIKFANRRWPAKEGEDAFTASVMQIFTNAGWVPAANYKVNGFTIKANIAYEKFFNRDPKRCGGRFTLNERRPLEPVMFYYAYQDGQTIGELAAEYNVEPIQVIMSIHLCQEKPDVIREYDERDD